MLSLSLSCERALIEGHRQAKAYRTSVLANKKMRRESPSTRAAKGRPQYLGCRGVRKLLSDLVRESPELVPKSLPGDTTASGGCSGRLSNGEHYCS